jgi:hypothetical protein
VHLLLSFESCLYGDGQPLDGSPDLTAGTALPFSHHKNSEAVALIHVLGTCFSEHLLPHAHSPFRNWPTHQDPGQPKKLRNAAESTVDGGGPTDIGVPPGVTSTSTQ